MQFCSVFKARTMYSHPMSGTHSLYNTKCVCTHQFSSVQFSSLHFTSLQIQQELNSFAVSDLLFCMGVKRGHSH